jgi:AcrR family transcriptional regulator
MDRRAKRTRTALVTAYNHLVLNRRERKISVADILAHADVGRSTFYEHYSGADALAMEALARPFAILADAAAGEGDPAPLSGLLAHFWENRHHGRDMICGAAGERAGRLLARMVAERLGPDPLALPAPLAARQLSEAALAPIRGWITAEAPCTPDALAGAICSGCAALLGALRTSPPTSAAS